MNLLGNLSWSAIPFDQPIIMGAPSLRFAVMPSLAGSPSKDIGYLWREWITSVDHKRIGVMYCVLALPRSWLH